MTKQQYINIQQLNKSRGCDIFPPYSALLEMKTVCRPPQIHISESCAQVSMQNILDHTAERIMELQKEVLAEIDDISHCTLITSYGFDGSTGQSIYKQQFHSDEPASLDLSLFVTTIIPLQLKDENQRIIWKNRAPQSVRFCRPLKIEYAKESQTKILLEKKSLDVQIATLKDYLYKKGDKEVVIKYATQMTLIDGKVLNTLTGTTSTQCCPICGVKPTELLETTDFYSGNFAPRPESLQYGASPLHAWIRFFEFVLNVSYRLEIRKWHIKQADKMEVMSRKKNIQDMMWKQMGLHINMPKHNGSGNSNDGNTARRAFSNTRLFSSVTNFDQALLHNFFVILITISTNYSVDVDKFKEFCKSTFSMYLSIYPWYPMSPTVHKILVHGWQIMNSSLVPVGCLGENASEARNKYYKSDRKSHARKNSRLNTMADVFYRAMDSSDPLISSICLNKRQNQIKKKNLPQDVIHLLKAVSPPTQKTINSDPENSDSDSDLDHESDCEEQYNIILDNEEE